MSCMSTPLLSVTSALDCHIHDVSKLTLHSLVSFKYICETVCMFAACSALGMSRCRRMCWWQRAPWLAWLPALLPSLSRCLTNNNTTSV